VATADLRAALATIRKRWEHGHDGLTPGCALCADERAEVRDLTTPARGLAGQHETRWLPPHPMSTIRPIHQKGPL
jgi:hypothetical protein